MDGSICSLRARRRRDELWQMIHIRSLPPAAAWRPTAVSKYPGNRTAHVPFNQGESTAAVGLSPAAPELAQDFLRRAKSSKGGLDQVDADEDRQPEPIGTDPVGEGQADENHRP